MKKTEEAPSAEPPKPVLGGLFGNSSPAFGQKKDSPALGLFAGTSALGGNKLSFEPQKTDKFAMPSFMANQPQALQTKEGEAPKPAFFGTTSLNFEKKEDSKPANSTTFTNPLLPKPNDQS